MVLLSLTLISVFAVAHGEAEKTNKVVRAEAIIPVPGIGSRNRYQIEIGHKGVVTSNLPDMAASYDKSDEVITLKGGYPRSVHDGVQVLRIQQEEPARQGSECVVVGLCLILASLVGIAMKLNEAEDPYSDLRGGSKPLTWVRMTVHSSMDGSDDGIAKIKKQGWELVNCISYMGSKALRKAHAKMRRMARPNIVKCDFGEGHQDFTQAVHFVPATPSEEHLGLKADSAPLLMPEELKPSECANLTVQALAKQLEEAGQGELAAQMLCNSSKAMAMGQMGCVKQIITHTSGMTSQDTKVEEDAKSESDEAECVI